MGCASVGAEASGEGEPWRPIDARAGRRGTRRASALSALGRLSQEEVDGAVL
jgi:hypothetical protein